MFSQASFAAAVSGALSDGVSATILFPLDVIKIRAQVDPKVTWQSIVQEEGVLGLYKGVEDKWIVSPQQKLQYFYMETAMLTMFSQWAGRKPSIAEHLLIGYLSALQGTLTTIPLDVTFTRRRVQKKVPGQAPLSFVEMFTDTVNKHGFASFYQGWAVNAVLCTNPAITFVCFERLREAWLHARGKHSLNALEAFVVGALSKAIATYLTFPMIRAKAIVNTWKQGTTPPSLIEIMQDVYDKEGIPGLFVGIYPQLTKGVLNSAIMLMIKDTLDRLVHRALKAH